MRSALDVFVFATGFAACWICKDSLLGLVSGAGALVSSLKARIAALRGRS
jgi:hypothetical protein